MIAEAIKYLAELATKAETPPILAATPRRTIYLVQGNPLEIEERPNARSHHVGHLEDVIALANRFADEGHKPVVWYREEDVSLVIDDEGLRLDGVTFHLATSDAFLRLRALRNGMVWHDQKQFIRLLRVELAGVLPPNALLDRVRRIKFENGVITSGQITRKDESLGREIRSRVEADGEIPEEVVLEVPVYKAMGEREPYPIRCSVDVDAARGALQLLPLPDEIERVQQLAVASIGGRLKAGLNEGIPAYYGWPG